MLTHLGMQLMGLVDTAVLGRYSEQALAGSGVGNTVLFAVLVLGMGSVMGLDTLIPQAMGANQRGRARALMTTGVRLSIAIGLPLTLLSAATPLLLPVFHVDPDLSFEAKVYILGRLPGIIPSLVLVALRSYLMAHKLTAPLVVAMVLGNLINLGCDFLLVFGVDSLGIPPLGVLGAATATTTVVLAQLVVILIAVRRVDANIEPTTASEDRRDILRVGVPVGLQLVAEVGVFALVGLLAGSMGVRPAAGHNVALMLASFTFSGALGLAAATSVRVGHAVGAGDTEGAHRAGAVGLVSSLMVMTVPAALFLAIPESLTRLITDEAAVVAAATPLLGVAALFQLSDGAQAVAAGALRGAGDTRAAFVGNVAGHYLLGVPVAVLLAFHSDLGAVGLWWGLSVGLTAVAIALWLRFFWLARRPIRRA